MKTCLIYGHNGLDLDVTMNLRSFYKSLGFKVFFSDRLYKADLLVVLRAVDKSINLEPFNFSVIHIFDYGGWDYDNFITSIDYTKTYIYCTSSSKRIKIIETTGFPEQQIFVTLPPVDIDLWTSKAKSKIFDFIHIGNFKPYTDDDLIRSKFINAVHQFKANIWGLGWTLKNLSKGLYHGKLGLFNVSKVYSKAKFSFGLMYPFQRNVTFSGRFWHAPLNGCYVFSEIGYYTNIMPGVIETDYSIEDIKSKIVVTEDILLLKQKAVIFWTNQNIQTKVVIMPSLERIKTNINFIKVANYILISTFNKLRIIYQYLP